MCSKETPSVERPIIAILTDFGTNTWYPAAMKGVILSICPDVNIVDISHEAPSYDVISSSFILLQTIKYFPKGTIFLVVVDPGVGTRRRRRIAIKTKNYYFVGPDNGVMIPAARWDGIVKIVEISNKRYMLPKVSKTFEGRDVFAPAAAYLARGVKIEDFGDEISDPVDLHIPRPVLREDAIEAEVIYIDKFGNIITNVHADLLQKLKINVGSVFTVEIKGRRYEIPFASTYGDVSRGEPLLLIDSSDYLELSINMGNAAETFGLKRGDKVLLRVAEKK